jgi:hypothetical protein
VNEENIYLYISHKKHEVLSFGTTGTELGLIMLNEMSQAQKDKYCMVSLICGIIKSHSESERIVVIEVWRD